MCYWFLVVQGWDTVKDPSAQGSDTMQSHTSKYQVLRFRSPALQGAASDDEPWGLAVITGSREIPWNLSTLPLIMNRRLVMSKI